MHRQNDKPCHLHHPGLLGRLGLLSRSGLRHRLLAIGLSFIIYHLSFGPSPARAQVGTWLNYLAYHEVQQICAAGDILFVRASNGLYQYNQRDQSITTYDRVNGLSDTNIKFIAWNPTARRLIAVYNNGNIDLIDTSGNITNISSLYTKVITADKTVNTIVIRDQYAYLATGFGIVKVNMQRAEIADTYYMNQPISGNPFYHNITKLGIVGSKIYAMARDAFTTKTEAVIPYQGTINVSFTYDKNGNIDTYSYSTTIVFEADLADNLLDASVWTSTKTYPSTVFDTDNSDYEQYKDLVATLNPGGPKYNYFGFMKYENDRLYTCGGFNNSTIPAAIQIYKDGNWEIYQNEGISDQTGINFTNVNCIDYDPTDNTHVFAGARSGLYEFRNGQFVNFYNNSNSPIEPFNGTSKNYQMVTGVKYDANGTLWLLNSQAPTQGLIEYTPSGEFISHHFDELMKLDEGAFKNKSNGQLTSMMIDSKGLLWFTNSHWSLPAFYVYDKENETVRAYERFVNQDDVEISVGGGVRCLVEDQDNNMWVCTNVGPLVLPKEQLGIDNPVFTQVKVPRNDGTNYADYLLSGVDITSLAIDQGGRKWFGTRGNGVYLISSDNIQQIYHFTSENSLLLSDIVSSVAIDNKTGEVFFGTDGGLCSYMSDATTTSEEMTKDNVYAYPNPVTPDYTGLISIVGLTLNADVKIVSSNGVLMAEGRSNGGTFTWDGHDSSGNRVASGIYMVMTATSDGKKGTVCKIAIVN